MRPRPSVYVTPTGIDLMCELPGDDECQQISKVTDGIDDELKDW